MKNVVMIIISGILGAITLAIVMTIFGRMNRSMELQALSSVIEETVENMALSKKYDIKNTEEYIADFIENLSMHLDTDSALTVDIMQADRDSGLLSVRVTETFQHPNGNKGTVSLDRTVVLNKVKETVTPTYTVQFFVGENRYKIYQVQEGALITAPADPNGEGIRFTRWKDANGYLADFTQPIEQERIYYME